jgi:hypothetical protein
MSIFKYIYIVFINTQIFTNVAVDDKNYFIDNIIFFFNKQASESHNPINKICCKFFLIIIYMIKLIIKKPFDNLLNLGMLILSIAAITTDFKTNYKMVKNLNISSKDDNFTIPQSIPGLLGLIIGFVKKIFFT